MIVCKFPSFFRSCGQAERVDGFLVVAHAADALEPRQHFDGALRQRRQGLCIPFHPATISNGPGMFTLLRFSAWVLPVTVRQSP